MELHAQTTQLQVQHSKAAAALEQAVASGEQLSSSNIELMARSQELASSLEQVPYLGWACWVGQLPVELVMQGALGEGALEN